MHIRTKLNILIGVSSILMCSTMLGHEHNNIPQQQIEIVTNTMEGDEEINDIVDNIGKEKMDVVELVEEKKEYIEIKVELTFYTSLASCNGDDLGLTASGRRLNKMTIAVPRKINSTRPVFPFGTRVYIDGVGERIVEDTGNPRYLKIKPDGTYILDVYVERIKGESDKDYKNRVLSMGRKQSTAKVYLKEGE